MASAEVRIKINDDQEKCFFALFEGRQIILDLEMLQLMLTQELGIDINSVDEKLHTALPYMLAFYIKNWPGWHLNDHQKKSLNYTQLFNDFQQYLRDRLSYLIKSGYDQVTKTIENDYISNSEIIKLLEVKMDTKESQTENNQKDIAPFKISISCPPKVMGTLVFADFQGEYIEQMLNHF